MGKRGPAPRGPFGGKTAVFSCRLRPDTKAALEAAAKASGQPLSQELERLLRRAFDADRSAEAEFGDVKTYALMKIAAQAIVTMRNLGSAKAPKLHWADDSYLYNQAVKAVLAVLELFRPPESAAADGLASEPGLGGMQGRLTALETVREAQLADPAHDLVASTPHQRRLVRLRDELGDLLDRARPYGRSAAQERRLHELDREIAPLLRRQSLALEQQPDGRPKGEPLTPAETRELSKLLERRAKLIEPGERGRS